MSEVEKWKKHLYLINFSPKFSQQVQQTLNFLKIEFSANYFMDQALEG